jgi:F-type H+-transporting ATPase subunit b
MRLCFRTALITIVLLLASGATTLASQTPNSPTEVLSASAAQSPADAAAGIRNREKEDPEENKEVSEDDGTSQFKQSPVVLALGRKLGLSGNAMYWLAVIVNFAIIALGIVYFSRLHLPTMFRSRTDSIRKAMDEAKVASEEARQRLAGIEARLANLAAEMAALQARADRDGAAEEARIRTAAEEDQKKIVEAASREIEVAAKAARRALAAYAADLAVNMARQRIQVDLPADKSLVSSFAQSLGKVNQ